MKKAATRAGTARAHPGMALTPSRAERASHSATAASQRANAPSQRSRLRANTRKRAVTRRAAKASHASPMPRTSIGCPPGQPGHDGNVLGGRPASSGGTRPSGTARVRPCHATSIGVSVNETASENNSEPVTTSAWSENSCPAMPCTNTIGKNTATVVSVEAVTAATTSCAPTTVDCINGRPCSCLRVMFSSTTIASSTSRPMASAMPPSDMMFSDTSEPYMTLNVAITDTGMASETTNVIQKLCRNRYSTKMASRPPRIAASMTSLMACLMNTDWS